VATRHIPVCKGEVFERLTVIGLSRGAENGTHVMYQCLCDCGVKIEVAASHLRRKIRTSCGCLRDERAKELGLKSRKKLVSGERFGSYVVLVDLGTNEHRKAIYKVRCACGHETIMTGARLRSGLKLHCYHLIK
jgi:hypothetical protein